VRTSNRFPAGRGRRRGLLACVAVVALALGVLTVPILVSHGHQVWADVVTDDDDKVTHTQFGSATWMEACAHDKNLACYTNPAAPLNGFGAPREVFVKDGVDVDEMIGHCDEDFKDIDGFNQCGFLISKEEEITAPERPLQGGENWVVNCNQDDKKVSATITVESSTSTSTGIEAGREVGFKIDLNPAKGVAGSFAEAFSESHSRVTNFGQAYSGSITQEGHMAKGEKAIWMFAPRGIEVTGIIWWDYDNKWKDHFKWALNHVKIFQPFGTSPVDPPAEGSIPVPAQQAGAPSGDMYLHREPMSDADKEKYC
jgi:hypothetical protein